jgi:molybdopterin-guanine dinucleotide biosynthesis protein A
MRVLGAVLAGGRSSRFGSDKAAADWRGASLADHASTAIADQVDATILVGPDRIADLPRPGLGPLGGIGGALAYAARHGYDSVLTIACDMPQLPAGLIETLLRRAPAYCVEAPVLGHWPTALSSELIAYVDTAPSRSVQCWAQSIGALPIVAGQPIANVNTPEDLMAW